MKLEPATGPSNGPVIVTCWRDSPVEPKANTPSDDFILLTSVPVAVRVTRVGSRHVLIE